MRCNLIKSLSSLLCGVIILSLPVIILVTTTPITPAVQAQQPPSTPIVPTLPPSGCQAQSCGDVGDAPERGMTAYPVPTATITVTSNFHTIYNPLHDSGPFHQLPEMGPYLGTDTSLEKNAHQLPDEDNDITNINVAANKADQDAADDGILHIKSLEECTGNAFAVTVTVPPGYSGPIYANVWFDYNRDGDWGDVGQCQGQDSPEWAIQNRNLSLGTGTQTLTVTVNAFHPPEMAFAPIWMRLTLSSEPAPAPGGMADGRGPAGGYIYGETEDFYLQYYDESCEHCAGLIGWQG